MALIPGPIIVDDNGDIQVFATVEEAEVYLEIRDIDRDDLRVYDSVGRRLPLRDASGWIVERVTIQDPAEGVEPPAELRARLAYCLRATGDSASDLPTASIEALASRLLAFQRPPR